METNNNTTNGFSLLDLLVTIVILGILVTNAVPQVFNYQLKAKRAEAITALKFLYAGELIYFAKNNTYAVVDGVNFHSVEEVINGLGLSHFRRNDLHFYKINNIISSDLTSEKHPDFAAIISGNLDQETNGFDLLVIKSETDQLFPEIPPGVPYLFYDDLTVE